MTDLELELDDETARIVRRAEDKAERQWLKENGEPIPKRLWPGTCLAGVHMFAWGYPGCARCGTGRSWSW